MIAKAYHSALRAHRGIAVCADLLLVWPAPCACGRVKVHAYSGVRVFGRTYGVRSVKTLDPRSTLIGRIVGVRSRKSHDVSCKNNKLL
jgi:hypothetical protein